MFTIDFEPVGLRGDFSSEYTLLECARALNVDLVSICGGVGSCERCKVQVITGEVSELTIEEEDAFSPEEIQQGYRLACLTYPLSDVKLHVPPSSLTAPQRTQVEGLEVVVNPDPLVLGVEVELTKPSLHAPQADAENLLLALQAKEIPAESVDYKVLTRISQVIRSNDWKVNAAVRGTEVVSLGAPQTRWLGLAVDIGTTKVAGYLIDVETGQILASKGLMNPQISYGEDVVSRIVIASKSPQDAERLRALLAEALDTLITDMCAETGNQPEQVVEAVVVGNTAIHHLFLGLPARQLGLSPYTPAIDTPIDIKARELGIHMAAGGYIHLLPNIAGYVGADHVSMLLATRLDEVEETTLAIDIGTNTEICLNHNGNMTSVSCASGPAFEGAHIRYGMRAAPGAIEHVRLEDGKLSIQTIGGEEPVGICGSGLLDVVAQMLDNDILGHRGNMLEHELVQRNDGQSEFLLAERDGSPPITISQKDVHELQLAKAAIRMGIQVLAEAEGLTEKDIDKVIIAGAFGTFIDVESAITIGMLPDLPLERFTQVGNAAGTGARLALVSKVERERAISIAERDGYIELAKVPNFNRMFAEASFL